jgi:isocitrate/isopropylmalate dehydrogenase
MMLDFLGEEQAARELMQAIETATGKGILTRDLGGKAKTVEFTDRVLAASKG